MKILGPTLFSDTLERPNTNAFVKWNSDCPLFSSLRMRVLQNRVVTPCPVVVVAKRLENSDNLFHRKSRETIH
jgi:hypothetical protein